MKIAVVLCLVSCAVTVYAENCTVNTDCKATLCNSGFHVICEHQHETGVTAGGGYCTCAKDDLTCVTKEDCMKDTINLQCITNRNVHCYDNKCICTRW